MKKITTLMIMVMIMAALTACGENTKEVETTVETETVEKAEEIESVEVVETVEEITEDVIGNTFFEEISLDNCRLWQMGKDFENKKLNNEEIEFDYTFLFPNDEFVTEKSFGYLKAEGDCIKYVDVNIIPTEHIPSASEGIIKETENSILFKTISNDSPYAYEAKYYLKDGEKMLCLTLIVKSKNDRTDEEAETYNNFRNQYITAFEESLAANI